MHELLEMISKDILTEELKVLNQIYPKPKSETDLNVIINDYYYLFKKYKEKVLLRAIDKYKQSDEKWFPTAAGIRFYYNQILRQDKFLKEHVERAEPVKKMSDEEWEKCQKLWKEKRQQILERKKI